MKTGGSSPRIQADSRPSAESAFTCRCRRSRSRESGIDAEDAVDGTPHGIAEARERIGTADHRHLGLLDEHAPVGATRTADDPNESAGGRATVAHGDAHGHRTPAPERPTGCVAPAFGVPSEASDEVRCGEDTSRARLIRATGRPCEDDRSEAEQCQSPRREFATPDAEGGEDDGGGHSGNDFAAEPEKQAGGEREIRGENEGHWPPVVDYLAKGT